MRLQEIDDWRKITVGATGHRPDRMGGYSNALGGYNRNHPIVTNLRGITLEVMEDLIANHGMTRFVSGGALGFDSLFFWCANHLKAKYPHIENVLAVPFLNQWKAWGDEQVIYWYHKMVEYADVIIDVARHPVYGTREEHVPLDDYSKTKMFKRNEYMVDQSCYLLAFFDGSRSGTGQCIRYAQRGIINRPSIIKLDPRCACKPEYI